MEDRRLLVAAPAGALAGLPSSTRTWPACSPRLAGELAREAPVGLGAAS
jgi:hypothetical protein